MPTLQPQVPLSLLLAVAANPAVALLIVLVGGVPAVVFGLAEGLLHLSDAPPLDVSELRRGERCADARVLKQWLPEGGGHDGLPTRRGRVLRRRRSEGRLLRHPVLCRRRGLLAATGVPQDEVGDSLAPVAVAVEVVLAAEAKKVHKTAAACIDLTAQRVCPEAVPPKGAAPHVLRTPRELQEELRERVAHTALAHRVTAVALAVRVAREGTAGVEREEGVRGSRARASAAAITREVDAVSRHAVAVPAGPVRTAPA
mmetsp:Transcript_64860/g.193276  ORF Transcript_64860/g.193276 Transcript_64860/m.193276 type:complete len:257 (+) Transcript_64860:168-938(+)